MKAVILDKQAQLGRIGNGIEIRLRNGSSATRNNCKPEVAWISAIGLRPLDEADEASPGSIGVDT